MCDKPCRPADEPPRYGITTVVVVVKTRCVIFFSVVYRDGRRKVRLSMRTGALWPTWLFPRKLCLKSRVSRWEIWILAGLPPTYVRVLYVCACRYVGPRRLGLLCAGMGCGNQYHRGMAPAGSPRAALFRPFPYYSRPRASGIICGTGIGRARRICELVPLDRPKSHEISMRNPY